MSTTAWAIGLGVATAVTYYGEYVLYDPNNFWTGWVLQLLPLLIAYHATVWFDERAIVRESGDLDHQPTAWQLFGDLVIRAVPLGSFVYLLGTAPATQAEALAVGGIALALLAWALVRRRRTARASPFVPWDQDEASTIG